MFPSHDLAGGTVYGADDEWSLGNYSSGAANTISADDDGVIFSVGTYKLFTFTSEQLALIDVNKVSVYIVDETGKRHFPNNATNGVNVTKPNSTTLKVELTNAVLGELGITKVWDFFVTDGVGYVAKLGVEDVGFLQFKGWENLLPSRAAGVKYTNNSRYPRKYLICNEKLNSISRLVATLHTKDGDFSISNVSNQTATQNYATLSFELSPEESVTLSENTGNLITWLEK